MFDPTIGEREAAVADNLHFYPFGLGTERDEQSTKSFKTLDTLTRQHLHSEHNIDILKMDVEGGEWKILPGLFSSPWFTRGKVKQFVLEVHFTSEDVLEQVATLSALPRLGYALFAADENWRWSSVIRVNGVDILNCLELSYVYVGASVALGGRAPQPTNAFWQREVTRRRH